MHAREIMVLLSNVRALGHELSDAFDQHGVPYERPRETRFKDTQPGRALLAMLRIISRPDDYVALRTLLELRKGVGVGTAAGIADEAIAHHLNYRDLFYEELPQDVFSSRQEKALACGRAVTDALADWSPDDLVEDRRAAVAEVLALILGHELDEQWTDEILALPEGATLAELSRFVGTEKADEEAAVVVAIRARMGETISLDEAMPPRVRVMTMHGAKGLSAQVVFIPGLEEEVLPGPARRPYPGQVLEAARMLYVSITRARLACVLSYADARFMNGSMTSHRASRFTSDVGKAFEARPGGMAADLVHGVVELAARL
jgi:superfamily I DNA/RNA helicase